MKRREFITLLGGAAVSWPLAARSQQTHAVRRIGVLMNVTAHDVQGQERIAAFVRSLRELSWTEGGDLQIDYRWAADAARMRLNVAQIVALKPDVILASGTPALNALKTEGDMSPVVFVLVSDPVASGFVTSLSRPGGNVTGFTNFEFSMGGKWVVILKDIMPQLNRVALIYNPDTAPYAKDYALALEAAARSFAVEPISITVRSPTQIESALAEFGRASGGGLIIVPDLFTVTYRDLLIKLADQYRLPTIYPYRYMAAEGGLLSYGVDSIDLYRKAASYVDRILRGEKPADLPVQQIRPNSNW